MHGMKRLRIALFMLVSLAPLLIACHTTGGAGRDLQGTGRWISNSAARHTPDSR